MTKSLRLLAAAAALGIVVAAEAAGQTVIVRGAAPGETVEVMVNDMPASSGTVAADGMARVSITIPMNAANRPELDARLYLDACDKRRRVLIIDRNQLPPQPEAGCARTEIGGVYWVRQRSTIVIDVSRPIPDVLLRQGSYNPNAPARRVAPKGLVAFGGGGIAKTSESTFIACGDVADCGDDGYVGAYNVGATLWLTRWLGVEGSYLRPSRLVVGADTGTFSFESTLDLDIVNVVAKIGAPIGPVRFYGQGGASHHDGVNTLVQTLGGATQTIETRTDGWSYTWGGGFEGWISERLALYGEAGRTKIKGKERLSGVIEIDDQLTHYIFGVRFRIF